MFISYSYYYRDALAVAQFAHTNTNRALKAEPLPVGEFRHRYNGAGAEAARRVGGRRQNERIGAASEKAKEGTIFVSQWLITHKL